MPVEEFYQRLQIQGMEYGPAFRGLSAILRGDNPRNAGPYSIPWICSR